jgi:hypothetical protein
VRAATIGGFRDVAVPLVGGGAVEESMHGLEGLIAGRVAPGVYRWEIAPEELFRTEKRRPQQQPGLTRTPDGRLALPLAMGGGHGDHEAPPWLTDAEDAGWEVFGLDEVRDEGEFLAHAGEVLEFPEETGDWDAFYDQLTDMEWLPAEKGYLLVWPGWRALAEAEPGTFATAVDVLRDAVGAWAESDTPMYVLLPGPDGALKDLQRLP